MDVKNRSVDMKTRKPFGLRSNYVQITFKLRSITFKLRKNYAKKSTFFKGFWGTHGSNQKTHKMAQKIKDPP